MNRTTGRPARLSAWLGVLVVLVATMTACVHNTEDTGAPTISPPVLPAKDNVIAALLPARIAAAGRLVVGVNVPYPPLEFRDSSGRIIGFDVDVMNAVGAVLGVRPDYVASPFEQIIPAVQAGTYDLGMSAFGDTLARERTAEFTDYFRVGYQWARRVGDHSVNPTHPCGLKVAVQTTTEEDTADIPAMDARCRAVGQPAIEKVEFDDQTAATTALLLGQVDAMLADSPVTAFAVKRTNGNLEVAGPMQHGGFYGWPVSKGSSLAGALQRAVQRLIDNGDFRRIADAWGVEAGMIDRSVINGASR